MSARKYRDTFRRHCELERYFPGGDMRVLPIPYPKPGGRVHTVHVPGRKNLTGTELHHICGSGNGAERIDVTSNIIMVCGPVHNWLETYKLPGFVLCCWAKLAKCELDWHAMELIKGKQLPGWLETDAFVEQCQPFPWVDQLRRNLITARPRTATSVLKDTA